MDKRPSWVLAAVIGVTVLVGAGILGYGVTNFLQYRSSALPIYPIPDHPQVIITSPISGSQHTLDSPVLVQVTASGPQKVESVELYVNSKLVGIDTAPPGGSHFYQAEFLWTPPEEGKYVLIAQVIGFEMLTGFSSAVWVEITAPAAVQEGGESAAFPIENFPDLQPEGALQMPEAPPLPGEKWKGSLENWLTSLRVGTPPNAPELSATTEECTTALYIHDLSDNEEGFEVWRSLPNSPTWAKIAVLASQSDEDWIAYIDTNPQGKTSYYVSAFNNHGVRISNLVQVDLDPRECMPPLTARSILVLELEEINFPVDFFYCYFSQDGEHWNRSPQVGFYPARDAVQKEPSIPTEILSMSLPEEIPNPEEDINPMTFYLDCWGWQGGSLKFLGAFTETLGPNQKGEVQVGSDGVSAALTLNLKELPNEPEFYPMGGASSAQLGIYEEEGLTEIPFLLQDIPIEVSMPFISAFITNDPASCQDHLAPKYQNENSMTFFCEPSPGFNYGPNGANPQPYFNWDPNAIPRCPNGQGPQCKDYYYWLSLAADLGHEVGFNVYDYNSKGFYIKSVTSPEKFNYTIPPKPCSGTREIWVQMWYYDGTSFLPTYGPPSSKASIPCPVALGPKMFLDVRFDQLVFTGIEDDESAPQDVEAFGYLRASSETMTRYLNLATWQSFGSFCPDEEGFINNQNSSQAGCPISFMDGIHSLSDQPLCRSKRYYSCSESGWDLNNNTLRLIIEDGDSLTLSAKILDQDSAAASDLVCEGTIQFPGQKTLEWHEMKDQVFMIQGSSTNSGTCHIFVTLNAVSP